MNKKAFNLKDFLINYGVILIIIVWSSHSVSPAALSPQGATCQQVVLSVWAAALQVSCFRRLTIPDVLSKAESL